MSKKPFQRRTTPDTAQLWRRSVQLFFLLLNFWIGIEFYFFALAMETGKPSPWPRPSGVEGWLPIAGLMNAKYALTTGERPPLHAPAAVLLLCFLALSWLFRKSFCGWLCPIGTLSEQLWKFGRRNGVHLQLPRWLDVPLRTLKYLLLAFFAWAVYTMSATQIAAFFTSDYGILVDLKLMAFFRHLSIPAATILGSLIITSLFLPNFWCRYACPYGALMGLASLLSPTRIHRDPAKCIDCAKCAKACPSALPVDRLIQIRSAECLGCMECVSSCPAEGALHLGLTRRLALSPRFLGTAILTVFFLAVLAARLTGWWDGGVPEHIYRELAPDLAAIGHPA